MPALILLTFFAFLVLWIGDLFLTLETAKRKGYKVEANPLLRIVLRYRENYVWIFKGSELILFLFLIYYLTNFSQTIPFYTLLGYLILYGLLVANNNKVYYNLTGKQSPVMSYVFIGVVILNAFFIFLNYSLYYNLAISYKALLDYKSSFSDLQRSCQQCGTPINNETKSIVLPPDLEKVLKSINFTIPKP